MDDIKEKFEKVCTIKDRALCLVEEQITGDVSSVNAKELGEVMDIAKDAAELIKYCTEAEYYYKVVESMENASDDEKSYYLNKYIPEYNGKFYTPIKSKMYPYDWYDDKYMRDIDLDKGRMYYTEPLINHNDTNMSGHYIRDSREGNSPLTRKHYMEIKHSDDKIAKAKELELYIQELGEDISDMLNNATTEEKTLVKQKLANLVNKM